MWHISALAKSADLNGDNKINYEEYTKYLSSLNLHCINFYIRQREDIVRNEEAKKDPNCLPIRIMSNNIEKTIRILKNQTNFSNYPIERLSLLTDFPYEIISPNLISYFCEIDKSTNKYKITVLSSLKVAILWYNIIIK